jgi:putative selenate reductase
MSDQFFPQSISSLLQEILTQLDSKDEILGLSYNQIFNPEKYPHLAMTRYAQELATPYGMAAGPHTQLARNIIAGWLMGARYIELKTIQTLDELHVAKPCIDMQDEGYNCEWSQELKITKSFQEYLNAWVIIHIIAHKMEWGSPQTIFNMSVGYNMEGILKDNVQWYFDKMADATAEIEEIKGIIRTIYPQIDEISIPSSISNNITLSTMHGCPPNEVEEISEYLIGEKKLHTTVKLNPTLLGSDRLRSILNDKLAFPIDVPDEAFEHDIKYPDAVKLIKNLAALSEKEGLDFAIKLTNTLEVNNTKGILPDQMMYMSGRALHPISVNLAEKLQSEFDGKLDVSFSAGADAENISSLLKCGLFPVTVSSDLLKPGGYGRLVQYYENIAVSLSNQMDLEKNAASKLEYLKNLKIYAQEVLQDPRYIYEIFELKNIKSQRPLSSFDCIAAPCMDACPTEQDIPDYLYWASKGDFNTALDVIYQKNPLPRTLGLVCEHGCQTKCTRINYDKPLRIRDLKEYIATHGLATESVAKEDNGLKVAIVGAGPSGLSAAWFLALEGFQVEIFEKNERAGGMPHAVIPDFRLNKDALQNDIDRILSIGVKIHFNYKIDSNKIKELNNDYHYVYIAVGAELSKKMKILGEESSVVVDPLRFLEDFKNGKIADLSGNILVIGGGNTAMDVSRTANKCLKNGRVTIVYRRTIQQMPAEAQEIRDAMSEGVLVEELLSPLKIWEEDGKHLIQLQKMQVSSEVGSDGRKKVKALADEQVILPADMIIPAIGQDTIPLFNQCNRVQDIENAIPDVSIYIGGDASRGASSIVQAVGDGRLFAEHILRLEDSKVAATIREDEKKSKSVHLESRSFKIESLYPKDLTNISQEEAIEEASRCLQCDEYCNVCVSVCPNRANHSYEVLPQTFSYQNIQVKGHGFELSEKHLLNITQDSQIYNIGDFCNECGNCSTFCPTAGDPYLDKPQVHFSQESFDAADRGYFLKDQILFAKNDGVISQLKDETGKFYYDDERLEVILAKDSLKILDVFIKQEGDYLLKIEPIIEMKLLLDAHIF